MRRAMTMLVCVAWALGGCANAWRDNFVGERSGARAASASVTIRGMPIEEVAVTPGPEGEVRVGASEFASAAGLSLKKLEEFAKAAGATTVYWGRSFERVTSELDYRYDYRPAYRTTRTVITRADGTKDEVVTTSNDGYYEWSPYSRTDAWYRYHAVFFAPAGVGDGVSR